MIPIEVDLIPRIRSIAFRIPIGSVLDAAVVGGLDCPFRIVENDGSWTTYRIAIGESVSLSKTVPFLVTWTFNRLPLATRGEFNCESRYVQEWYETTALITE